MKLLVAGEKTWLTFKIRPKQSSLVARVTGNQINKYYTPSYREKNMVNISDNVNVQD